MNNLIFEKLETTELFTYGYANYDNYKVTMRSDGYVNMTKFLEVDTNSIKEFLEKENIKSVLTYASQYYECETSELFDIVDTGNEKIRGLYIHQFLFPYVASSFSPKFALKFGKLLNKNFKVVS